MATTGTRSSTDSMSQGKGRPIRSAPAARRWSVQIESCPRGSEAYEPRYSGRPAGLLTEGGQSGGIGSRRDDGGVPALWMAASP